MIDREKIIKGLQCIIEGTVRCESCGYAIDKHGHHSCQQNCASDAIALLKESKNEYENGFNDAMLGKQELMYEGTDGKWHKKDW